MPLENAIQLRLAGELGPQSINPLQMKMLIAGLTLFAVITAAFPADRPATNTFAIGDADFLLNGNRFQIRCGEIHAPRVPCEYWRHRLQMARALGLNTVCAYLFWNMHEPKPGVFDWSGQADAAEFCRIAQEEGLWVLLRPGPYSCAEWEMGGLPWWLLKDDDIQMRTRDARFMTAASRYLKEVGRVLAPLQVTRGGPILMVQVENEYGFYGKDAEYMGALRAVLLDAGFDVPLFACNPPYTLKNGYRADLFQVVNFGSDPAGGFKALRGVLPKGPLMCGEFYPGWFDTWGAPHHAGNTAAYLKDLEYMLKAGASFSIYMAHGGTSFGFSSGADRPFKPDTSSYDYDAPISEAGWTTDKFLKTRDLFAKYLLPGEKIPAPPARNRTISLPRTDSTAFASLLANLPDPRTDLFPRSMEKYDQAHGCVLYRTQIAPGPAATLECAAIHDFAQIFLGDQRIGFMDRRSRSFKARLPERKSSSTLSILVEAMGRVNFGTEAHDRKGLHAPVKLMSSTGETQLKDWSIYCLPLDPTLLASLKFDAATNAAAAQSPGFWRAAIDIPEGGDCFLDMRSWGKGVAWVNGHNLGRYWNIGPQQTMYIPGPWLRPGKNEIIILDLLGPAHAVVAALEQPILDQLRPELDLFGKRRPLVTLQLDSSRPVHSGTFAAGTAMQEVKFSKSENGRYFALESINAQDGKAYAAIAELTVLDQSGQPIPGDRTVIAYVDSEERGKEDGSADNAIDGQTANFWHTQWSDASPSHPHQLILDLGQSRQVGGFRYVPRQGASGVGGRIKDFRVYVGDSLVQPKSSE